MTKPADPTDLGTHLGARTHARRIRGRLRLLVMSGDAIASHDLPARGSVIVGRDPSCAIVLADGSVSRRHAQITIGEHATVEDLGSSRGTFVGSLQLAPSSPTPLNVGQLARLGRVGVMLHELDATHEPTGLDLANDVVDRVAPGTISVLVQGETGVGKERMAARVHAKSPRAAGPFITLNCGAFTESLLESELFGHVKGAFTGASADKLGLVEAASGGTLFLDEIGELSPSLQVKLLRVFEAKEVRRVGAVTNVPVDIRLVSATHKKLEAEVAAGRFREDLFYRIAGITVFIPPLRERRAEILALVQRFLDELAPGAILTDEATRWLVAQDWPGNIRQLRNTVERAALLAGSAPITIDHLQGMTRGVPQPLPTEYDEHGDDERQRYADALEKSGGNQTAAAKLLGVSRRTLINRIEKYGLIRPRKR
jgi:DNA-binding NtrC family response regulator